jgi:1-acyl-sn-glycerol-3-phosphate acyltransferase
VRAGWNEVEPPVLPPLTLAERLRLILRAVVSVASLCIIFAVFLLLRGIDLLAARLAGRAVTRLGPQVVRLWAAQALPTLGLRFVQHGRPMDRGGAFVANHSSWLDIVALQRAAAPFLVSKAEVRSWPVIGHIGRAIGTMFIDRRPAEAKRQEAQLFARLVRGDRMAIFPEGTSTDGQRVLPFKSALFGVFFSPDFTDGMAVQPVTIAYRPRPGLPASFYGWWGEMDFAGHLRDVMARSTRGVVELTFHPPLPLADFPDRKALAQAADAAVRAGLEQRLPRGGETRESLEDQRLTGIR